MGNRGQYPAFLACCVQEISSQVKSCVMVGLEDLPAPPFLSLQASSTEPFLDGESLD